MKPGAYLIFMVAAFSLIILGMFVWHFLNRRLARDKAAHELRLRLLQTAGSAKELAELVHSPEGQSLFQNLQPDMTVRSVPDLRRSALRAVQFGVVLFFVGLGMAALALFTDPNKGWLLGAALTLSMAVGLVVSAMSSIWLSRKLDGTK